MVGLIGGHAWKDLPSEDCETNVLRHGAATLQVSLRGPDPRFLLGGATADEEKPQDGRDACFPHGFVDQDTRPGAPESPLGREESPSYTR